MKVVMNSPMGSFAQETGLLFLLAHYMRAASTDMINLRCNGVFSLCDRDAEINWRRDVDSCIKCMQEQSTLSQWSGIETADLSPYLSSEDVERTKRWLLAVPTSELTTVSYEQIIPFELCKHLFIARFGIEKPVETNKQHEQFLRRAILSVSRTCIAMRRFLFATKPNLVFVGGARDFISQSLYQESLRMGFDAVLFRWSMENRAIRIHHPKTDKILSCDLVMSGVTQMRGDARTWPLEVVSTLDDILNFMGIPRSELLFPAAKQ